MIVFPAMLVPAAEKAGIKTPDSAFWDGKSVDDIPNDCAHFKVFCLTQLARPMMSPTEHWSNAIIIASIPEDTIRTVTVEDLREMGFVGV